MKKNMIMILVIMTILSACSSVNLEKSGTSNTIVLDEKLNNSDIIVEDEKIEIIEGAACTPYSPHGQVLYDFETTSEYPEIEKINEDYKTATFGLGWFWEPSARFAVIDGVFRTRVGYAGGSSINPSYTNLGLHTEVVEIDYDPEIISYSDLIDEFFDAHNETLRPYDQRVKSLVFYRDKDEFEIAKSKLEKIRVEAETGKSVYTELKEFSVFYIAEEKNQNRSLKTEISLYEEIKSKFGSEKKVLLSVLASKLNGVVYGYGSAEKAEEILSKSALSDQAIERVKEIISMRSENQ